MCGDVSRRSATHTVCPHVYTVRVKGQAVERNTASDLCSHGADAQDDDEPRFELVGPVAVCQKVVRVPVASLWQLALHS